MLNNISDFNYNIGINKYHIFNEFHTIEPTHVNVMMIDDNKRDINLVKELLFSEGSLKYNFSSFTHSHEALTAIENNMVMPNLIILDLVMPCINGKMMLKRIKSLIRTKNIPVIIHSSMNNYENITKTSELEAHAFFAKPLDIEVFENFILGKL